MYHVAQGKSGILKRNNCSQSNKSDTELTAIVLKKRSKTQEFKPLDRFGSLFTISSSSL